MRKISFVFCLCLFAAQALSPLTRAGLGQARGSEIYGLGEATTPTDIASLYGGSYALLVGVSKYDYWDTLPGVKEDIAQVGWVLKQRGFQVEVAEDPGSDKLLPLIKDFLNRRGGEPQARLLVYYAGHGHRYIPEDGGRGVGFIVPRDAPLPGKDMASFTSKAVNMDELLAPAKIVMAKHLLFVLDTCYAGSILDGAVFDSAAAARVEPGAAAPFVPAAWQRPAAGQDPEALPYVPQHILSKAREPVRQFIASGTYKQSVPDDSNFRRKFVSGLTDESGGGADANGDSYVTVAELGEYLQENVTNQSAGSQRPLWGVLGNKAASQGDFVFVMPGATALGARLGPVIDPAQWNLPEGWSYRNASVVADAPGLMLPRKLVRHSFHDFRFTTRLKLVNQTAARLVLRAQGRGDYYLLRLTGDRFPGEQERFKLSIHVVRGGREVARLSETPLAVDERRLVTRLKNKDEIQIVVVAEGDTFTVSLLSDDDTAGALLLMVPIKFVDAGRNFRYGAPGYLTASGERLQIFTSHVRKLEPSEKGRQ